MNYIVFFLCFLLLFSCRNRTYKSITTISVCVNPIISNGCMEISDDRVYFSSENNFNDSIGNFESIKVSKMTRVEFKEIEKLILSSDLLKSETGEYTVGENRFCLEIEYSDRSTTKIRKS